MNALKSVLLTLVLLTLALTGYIFYKFDANYFLKAAAKAYAKEDYVTAEKLLSSFKRKAPAKAHLYQGYVLRAQSKPSDFAFEKAHETADETSLKEEASFNLLLNAYLSRNYSFIEKHLEKEEDSAIGSFFAALLFYQEKDFERAYHCFLQAEARECRSPFMQKEWDKYFPKLFEVTRKAHCLIEIGKPAQGRKLLENSLKEFEDTEGQISKLIGWTYLKEAEHKPLKDSLPYIKMAKPHLASLTSSEREKLKDLLVNRFNQMQSLEDFEALYPYATFAHSLSLFDEVTTYVAMQTFEEQKKNLGVRAFIQAFKEFSDIPELRLEMKKDNTLENYLCDLIKRDEQELEHTYELMLFWDGYERDDEMRLAFIETLFPLVKSLWAENTIKALHLSKYLDQFSHRDQKPLVQQTILEILQDVCADGSTKEEQEAYLYFNPLLMR